VDVERAVIAALGVVVVGCCVGTPGPIAGDLQHEDGTHRATARGEHDMMAE
jgi:hypothetical protein